MLLHGHNLSLICQPTSEDIKLYIIINICDKTATQSRREGEFTGRGNGDICSCSGAETRTQCTKYTVIYEHQDRFMVYSNDSGNNKYPLNDL